MFQEKRNLKIAGLVAIMAILAVGCAAGDPKFTETEPAGFWYGLWHGLIIGISFVVSLFAENTTIYEINNTGGWYNFGFVLGVL